MHRISLVVSLFAAVCLPGTVRAQTPATRDSTDSLHTRPAFTTTTTFTQADLRQLPIDDPLQAFGFVPGVVERSGYLGVATPSDLSIHGGPAGDAAFFIDGAPARLETFGGLGIELPLNAVARASLSTGPIGAEISAPRNAVIAFQTRRGGDRVMGEVHAETDGLFGSGSTVGYNRFEASLGGPMPSVSGLTWFVAGSAVGQQSRYRGLGAGSLPAYVPYGTDTTVTAANDPGNPLSDSTTVAIPNFAQWGGHCGGVGNPNTTQGQQIASNYGQSCQGLRRPRDWTSDLRGVATVHYAYGAGSSVSLTGVANALQQRNYPANLISAPGLQTGTRRTAHLLVANWTQALGTFHGGALGLHLNLSAFGTSDHAGTLAPSSELGTRDPSLGIEATRLRFLGADSVTSFDIDQLITNVREHTGFMAPNVFAPPSQPYRFNPYGMAWNWPTSGNVLDLALADETRVAGAASVSWAATARDDVRLGADFDRDESRFYAAGPLGAVDLFHVRPRRVGVYLADRMRTAQMSLDLGLRYAWYTPGGAFPNSPGRTFTLPGWTGIDSIDAQHFHVAPTQTFWLPTARLAVEVAPRASVHIGAAREVVPPDVYDQFTHTNTDIALTSTGTPYGQDLAYAASNALDAGVTYREGSFTIEGTVYHETAPNPYTLRFTSLYDSTTGGILNLNMLTADPRAVTGADLRLRVQAGPGLRAEVAYGHVSVAASGVQQVFPSPQVSVGATSATPPGTSANAVSVLLWLTVPSGVGSGVVGDIVRGGGAVLAFRAASGAPYTPCGNAGSGLLASAGANCAPGFELGPINSAHLPWSKLLDLRVTKRIAGFGGHWSAFLDVRNLFNTEVLSNAFVETGSDTNPSYELMHVVQPAIDLLQSEAPASAHLANGALDLRTCQGWVNSTQLVDCYALRQTENRFGNGDGVFTQAEQTAAFGAYYDFLYGPWAFHGPGRTARVGIRFDF